jgi:alkanesulfonate monooxygenase SsuD/methylene tetrahydromethanopterin reductase-like flavin-dependent oxidoreductase (luciferase family)
MKDQNTEEINLSIDNKEEVLSEVNTSTDDTPLSTLVAGTPEERIAALLQYIDQSQERMIECATVRRFLEE